MRFELISAISAMLIEVVRATLTTLKRNDQARETRVLGGAGSWGSCLGGDRIRPGAESGWSSNVNYTQRPKLTRQMSLSPLSSRRPSPNPSIHSLHASIRSNDAPDSVELLEHATQPRAREPPAQWWVLVNQASFVLTGVLSTLTIQSLYNHGAANEQNGLVVGVMYLGMAMARFIPLVHSEQDALLGVETTAPRTWFPVSPWRGVIYQLAGIDMISNIVITLGLFWVGSGIYQVIYASVVVFAALFLRCFMPKEKGLNTMQWIAILVVTLGLALSGLGAVQSVPVDSDGSTSAATLFFGVVFCVLGTMGYASIYVLNQRNFAGGHLPPPDPVNVCGWIGSVCSVGFVAWFLANTVPRWHVLVSEPIRDAQGHVPTIVCLYLMLCVDQFLHNYNYYVLIDCMGAVTTGVLQSLRSIIVFLLSAALFCGPGHEGQCLNASKVASCVVVVSGVLLYSVVTARKLKE